MPRPARELRDLGHVGRFGPLRALALLVGDSCALRERLEALAGDAAVMHEQVLSAFIGSDEAVALAVVEPLDGSVCHKNTSFTVHERVRKAPKRKPNSLCSWSQGSRRESDRPRAGRVRASLRSSSRLESLRRHPQEYAETRS